MFDRARDVAYLRRLHPQLMSFENWVRASGWDGTVHEVQARPVQVGGRDDPARHEG